QVRDASATPSPLWSVQGPVCSARPFRRRWHAHRQLSVPVFGHTGSTLVLPNRSEFPRTTVLLSEQYCGLASLRFADLENAVGLQFSQPLLFPARPCQFHQRRGWLPAKSEVGALIARRQIATARGHHLELLQPGGRDYADARADAVAVAAHANRLDGQPVI